MSDQRDILKIERARQKVMQTVVKRSWKIAAPIRMRKIEEDWKCPKCYRINSLKTRFCTRCGSVEEEE